MKCVKIYTSTNSFVWIIGPLTTVSARTVAHSLNEWFASTDQHLIARVEDFEL